MLSDIVNRYSGVSHPDLLFVTGDIAFSGKEAEYLLAEEFLTELTSRLSLSKDQVFLVPGNHDIDRDLGQDTFQGARAKITTPLEVDHFFESMARRRELFSRQKAFRNFASRISNTGGTFGETDFAHYATCDVGPIHVRVLLIDSAWLADGGDADKGHLAVGERQVDMCSKSSIPSEACFTFALMHHPFAWLTEFDGQAVQNQLIELADVCLQGHIHSEDHRTIASEANRLPIFTAGAAFLTRESENCYDFCALDLSTGLGTVITHRYRQVENRWIRLEPLNWSLTSAGGEPSLASIAITIANDSGASYPSYLACLLSGLNSEVPVNLPSEGIGFVVFDTEIPDLHNSLGKLVRRLRHHLYWRTAWNSEAWMATMRELIADWNRFMQEFSESGAQGLSQKETESHALLKAVGAAGSSELRSAVVLALRSTLAQGDLAQSRSLLERWRGDPVLTNDEQREVQRFEIELLTAEGQHEDAWKLAEQLMALGDLSPFDFALCAGCAFQTNRASEAARLMHIALNKGVPIEAVRKLALEISSVSGDATLVARVKA